MKSTNHILDTALEISDQAAELIRLSSKKIKSFKSKGEISNLVTQTDIEADKLISSKIKETLNILLIHQDRARKKSFQTEKPVQEYKTPQNQKISN